MWNYPPPCLLTLAPPSSYPTTQQSAICSGMVQFVFVRLRKMAQIYVVKLKCKNRCWLVSAVFPHNEHQDTIIFPFLLSTSCVRQALLANNYVKHFILVGAKVFHTFLHKLCLELRCCGLPILYALLTVKAPFLLCFHLKESGALVMRGNFSNALAIWPLSPLPNHSKTFWRVDPTLVFSNIHWYLHQDYYIVRTDMERIFRGICLFHASAQNLVLGPSPTSMYVLASSFAISFW